MTDIISESLRTQIAQWESDVRRARADETRCAAHVAKLREEASQHEEWAGNYRMVADRLDARIEEAKRALKARV